MFRRASTHLRAALSICVFSFFAAGTSAAADEAATVPVSTRFASAGTTAGPIPAARASANPIDFLQDLLNATPAVRQRLSAAIWGPVAGGASVDPGSGSGAPASAAGEAEGDPGGRARQANDPRRGRGLIIKYRSHGASALSECADRLSSRGAPFAGHTRDRSDSLDRVHARYGLRRHHALFRAPSDDDFATARSRLRTRYQQRIDTRNRDKRRGARPLRRRAAPDLSHVYQVEVSEGVDLDDAISALRADPHVEYAQRDYALELDQALPLGDPFLASSGSWGQPYADLWGLEQIGASGVWDLTRGEGIVVGVVDTGLDRFHPDIAANVWVNPGEDLDGDGRATEADANGIDDDGNGFIDDLTGFDFADSFDEDQDGFFDGLGDVSDADPFDVRGHGTHVAGTIAAVAGNGIGIAGVAPRAQIMALRGFPEGRSGTASTLWRAVLYAAENGASVINNSWSCSDCPENPIADDVLTMVDALDTVVVTSAGNAAQDVLFRSPESGSKVITVGALSFTELPASFSNRGYGIDVMAPGGGPSQPSNVRVARRNILSLLTSAIDPGEEPFAVGSDYWRLAGTSMSSPHVAGAVALLRSLRPELTPADIRRLVRLSARDLGLPGHDPVYGAGLLDVPALLAASLPDLDLQIESPAPNSIHDPSSGPLVLRGRALGGDLASVEISVARGISGRAFETIATWGPSSAGDDNAARVLTEWDVRDVPDGPHVIRLRAHLVSEEIVDEFLVVSIERNAPLLISAGTLAVGEPDLAGRRVVWPVAESGDARASFDLALGRLRLAEGSPFSPSSTPSSSPSALPSAAAKDAALAEPHNRLLFEREGSQNNVAMSGDLLAWRVQDGAVTTIEWCRLEEVGNCEPEPVENSGGFIADPFVGGDWIVWHRDFAGTRTVEGCYVDPNQPRCDVIPLVDDEAARRWTARSFDGDSILVESTGEYALCRLDARGVACQPSLIEFVEGTPSVFEPVHEGSLMAFSEVAIESRPPLGCLPFELVPGCFPNAAVVVGYRACWLEAGTNRCDSVSISPLVRAEYFIGLEVAGRRIAWSMATATEEATVQFCEFDPVTRTCETQRVTGSAARQDGVALDKSRIVWRDGRRGARAIWGTELTTIHGPTRVWKRAGSGFAIAFWVSKGAAPALSYSVNSLSGLDPSLANVRFEDVGSPGGLVRLVGVLPSDAVGGHRWRVRVEGSGGLYSESTFDLEALPVARRNH